MIKTFSNLRTKENENAGEIPGDTNDWANTPAIALDEEILKVRNIKPKLVKYEMNLEIQRLKSPAIMEQGFRWMSIETRDMSRKRIWPRNCWVLRLTAW